MEHFESIKHIRDCLDETKALVGNKTMLAENGYFKFQNIYDKEMFIILNKDIKNLISEFEKNIRPDMDIEKFEAKFKEEIVPLCKSAKDIKYSRIG